eukprot:15433942-Alexandrium_andersonii.AAC.1
MQCTTTAMKAVFCSAAGRPWRMPRVNSRTIAPGVRPHPSIDSLVSLVPHRTQRKNCLGCVCLGFAPLRLAGPTGSLRLPLKAVHHLDLLERIP